MLSGPRHAVLAVSRAKRVLSAHSAELPTPLQILCAGPVQGPAAGMANWGVFLQEERGRDALHSQGWGC